MKFQIDQTVTIPENKNYTGNYSVVARAEYKDQETIYLLSPNGTQEQAIGWWGESTLKAAGE